MEEVKDDISNNNDDLFEDEQMEAIDTSLIIPVKKYLIDNHGSLFWADMYFPKDDAIVFGNIIHDENIDIMDRKVVSSIILSNGIVIHEFMSDLSVKTFLESVNFAIVKEMHKNNAEFTAYKACRDRLESSDYV